MKLVSVKRARSLWFFHTDDLNPRGKDIRDAPVKVAERYSFTTVPTAAEIFEAQQKNGAIQLFGGSFKTKRGERIVVDFSFYKDGIVGDTRSSTSDTDEFLADLLAWVPEGLGLPVLPGIPHRKGYISELYVSFDKPLATINPKLTAFCKTLSIDGPTGAQINFEHAAIAFWADPTANPGTMGFRIERAEGVAFSENRYYALAPTGTEKHIKILEGFEQLLTN